MSPGKHDKTRNTERNRLVAQRKYKREIKSNEIRNDMMLDKMSNENEMMNENDREREATLHRVKQDTGNDEKRNDWMKIDE